MTTADAVMAQLEAITETDNYVRHVAQAKVLNQAYELHTMKLVKVLPISPIGSLPPGEIVTITGFIPSTRGVVAGISLDMGSGDQVLVEGFIVDAESLPATLTDVSPRSQVIEVNAR